MKEIQIARLEEHSETTIGGVIAVLMFVLGGIGMFFSLADNSAIRGAMYGAAWTGWNVIWAAVFIRGRRQRFVVYREARDQTLAS